MNTSIIDRDMVEYTYEKNTAFNILKLLKNVLNMPARLDCSLLSWHIMEELLNKNGK